MSGIVGSLNTRGSGLINLGSASDGQLFTGTGAGLPVGFEAAAGGGKVLQVVSTAKTDTYSSTAPTTMTNITGFNVAITPAATSSKVLIIISVGYATPIDNNAWLRLVRGTTAIAVGDARSSRIRMLFKLPRVSVSYGYFNSSFTFLDSPSSSAEQTYHLQIGGTGDAAQIYLNRSHTDPDNSEGITGCSTITAIEIGA